MQREVQEGLEELWKRNILKKFWSRADSKPVYYTDLVFKCQDGAIEAHKSWLSNSCHVLGKAVMNIHTCLENAITILVPDFSIRVVKKFLQLFYTGSVELSSYVELEEIKEFGCKELGLAMSLDQLKFVSLVESEPSKLAPQNLTNLNEISAFSRKRRSGPKHGQPKTPTGPRGDSFDSMMTLAAVRQTISEATRHKPMPKKFKPNNELQSMNPEKEVGGSGIGFEGLEDEVDSNESLADPDIEIADIDDSDIAEIDLDDDQLEVELEDLEEVMEESNGNEMKASAGHSVRQTKIKNFSCSLCRKKFVHETGLERHVRKAHLQLKTEERNDSGIGNISNEPVDEETGFIGEEIGPVEETPNGTSQSDFACQECGKTFKTKTRMKQHMDTVHQSDPENCFVCEKSFKNKATLKAHLKKQHTISDGVNIYT